MTDISKRLAEIRERDDLVHELHGNGWDDHATDAEMDRAVLLAAVDAVLTETDESVGGTRLAADLGLLDESDLELVLHVSRKIREAIAAALSDTRGGAR